MVVTKMKLFGYLVSFKDSKKIILENINPIKSKTNIPISQALDRVNAENIYANFDLPSFDRAAMDGYAVRAKDTFGALQYRPKILKIVGTAEVGKTLGIKVMKGEAVRIATGAKLPQGTDAVVMAENAEEKNKKLKIFKSVAPKENIGLRGEDIKRGSLVIKEEDFITASKIGVVAGLGISKIKVWQKPKVAIIPTGEEVCEVGKELKEGQVYDINTHTISAIVKNNGCKSLIFPIIPDKLEALRKAVIKSLKCDLIVFSGGSSVGERDLLVNVVQELGEIKFHGIQMKPGKPTLFGIIKGKPIFGMPGYPTSCLLNAYLLLAPALRKLARLPKKEEIVVKAKLAKRVHGSLGRRFFLTVRLEKGLAIPVFKESGAITSMSEAQGYIEIPENVDVLEKGEEVEVKLF
ncbi:MAG: molybdopterin-binding protein [Candidatus Thermoplasmatota archaeon]|nr:molybdopterin-binding protein [Candidatus Thermoplasmatota archaeon]